MRAWNARLPIRIACFILLLISHPANFLIVQDAIADGPELINGFHLRSLPGTYEAQERLMASFKGSGANAVLLELPQSAHGELDLNALSNAIYLVHQAGCQAFLVMPTRRSLRALERNPAWEDRRYDLVERSLDRSGRLDLFQDDVVAYLAEQGKVLAEHAVDGILLGEDFVLETGDGFGKQAVAQLEKKLKIDIAPRKLFGKTERAANGDVVTAYGAGFGKWTEAKRDRLLETYEAIRSAARKVNPKIKIGVPVPVVQPVATAQELLERFAFDQSAYRRIDVDLYWTAIDYRDQKADAGLTFSESVQFLARSAYAVITSVKDTSRLIVVLQASTAAGRAIPLTEIEQTTELVRRAGRTGIVYSITPLTVPSATLTKKMFQGGD